MTSCALCPLLVTVIDASTDLIHHFLQCSTQGVIIGFCENVRPWSHQMRTHTERRTSFQLSLNENVRFVDPERFAHFLEMPFDQRSE